MWMIIWISISFCAGMLSMAILKRTTDDECRSCEAEYERRIDALRSTINQLEAKIHGLKSTRGALGQQIQRMTWKGAR